MPWTCPTCAADLFDDVDTCPSCGVGKSSWTLQADKTRALQIGARTKLVALRGTGREPLPRDDPGNAGFETEVADHCLVLPKARLESLVAAGQLPAPAERLVIRVTPRKDDREVLFNVEFAHGDLGEHELEGPSELVEQRFDLQVVCVFGPEELALELPGITVIDLSEESETGYAPSVEVEAVKKTVELPTRALGPPPLDVLEVEDICFATGREVLLPGGWSAGDDLTGLSVVAAALGYARKQPSKRLLLAGHTDSVGSVQSNQVLSEDRAANVHLYLSGQREAWAAHSDEHAEDEDCQSVLKWIAWLHTWDCDPGAIDGEWGKGSQGALERFRARYAEEYGRELPAKQGCHAADWEAFFDLYERELAFKLKTQPERLGELRAQVRPTEPPTIGCSERFPTERPGAPPQGAANRRVDVLFFPESDLPELPGDPPGSSVYGEGAYTRAYLSVDDAFQEPEPPYGNAPFEDVNCPYKPIHREPEPDPAGVEIERSVSYDVPLVRPQGLSDLASCGSMVVAWRDEVEVVPQQLSAKSDHWEQYAAGIDAEGDADAIEGFRLQAVPRRTLDAQGLVELLEQKGPLWLTGSASERVLTGVVDAGGVVNVLLNDPRQGQLSLRYTTFAFELERQGGADAPEHHVAVELAHA